MTESIANELAALFPEFTDLRSAIVAVCWPGAAFIRIEEVSPWEPGGSETYCRHLRLVTDRGSKRLIMKAFVPFPGTIAVIEALRRTVERTRYIHDAGLRVPAIYSGTGGVILTEYIPESLTEALRRDPSAAAAEAARYLTALARIGMDASSCVHDLRFADDHACLVDLGSDLREGVADGEDRIAERALTALARALQVSSSLTSEAIYSITRRNSS